MEAPEMENYRIVLADDHVLIRHGLRKLIDGVGGIEVVGEAADGLELLKVLEAVAPHMVILDISMPNLRGVEAIGEIRKRLPRTKILMLSMHKEYLHNALSAGANGYLLKEDADRDLFSAIGHIRQGRTYVSPRLAEQLIGERLPASEVLSSREKEIVQLIASGKSNREIAVVLNISIRTVESHRANIMVKLNLRNVADLVKFAIQNGYI